MIAGSLNSSGNSRRIATALPVLLPVLLLEPEVPPSISELEGGNFNSHTNSDKGNLEEGTQAMVGSASGGRLPRQVTLQVKQVLMHVRQSTLEK